MGEVIVLAPGSAVLVTAATLDPIAKVGQVVLLAPPEQSIGDGDLIAAKTADGNHLLRRVWSDGARWILQAINPVEPEACVIIGKAEAAMRKINGVIYHLPIHYGAVRIGLGNEWMPMNIPIVEVIKKLKAITVVGDSLEPIAKTGQRVLVGEKHEGGTKRLNKGTLAVVETNDPNIGNVIKRVFPSSGDWLLDSVNPVDPHDPLSISERDIRAAWPLHGVLFDVDGTSVIWARFGASYTWNSGHGLRIKQQIDRYRRQIVRRAIWLAAG